ncbi:unnamed protein product [Prorocentrum cordatum]|uniref:Uncharacterized protein n=1 Tax=Prorocentrum cordatum TaxID=2364126 RepID=A0ABN9SGZ5_9DINO|nr:unnamed protein product [Polarella glacialis]
METILQIVLIDATLYIEDSILSSSGPASYDTEAENVTNKSYKVKRAVCCPAAPPQDGEAMNSENDTPCFGGAPERGAAAGVLTVSEGGDRLSMTRDRTPTMAGACAAALAEDSWVSRPPPVPDVAPGGEVALRADGQICTADAAPVPEFGGPASSLNGAGPGAASAAASFTASLPALAPTGDRHAGSLAAGRRGGGLSKLSHFIGSLVLFCPATFHERIGWTPGGALAHLAVHLGGIKTRIAPQMLHAEGPRDHCFSGPALETEPESER